MSPHLPSGKKKKKTFSRLDSFDANPPNDDSNDDDHFIATEEDVAAWEAGLCPPPRPRHRELRYADGAGGGGDEKNGVGGGSFSRYVGETLGGLRHGHGMLEGSNGDKYEGTWRLGLRHGKGKATFPSREKASEDFEDVGYEGDWRDDKADG